MSKLDDAVKLLETASGLLADIQDDLQEKFDSHSETWQEGDEGAEMQENIDAITGAIDAVDITVENLQNVNL